MSIPVKHHYLPVFYLERWANSSGKVCGYQRPYESVTRKSYFPTAVGYKPNLYTIESRLDAKSRQEVESGFMQMVDNSASEALALLETDNLRPDDSHLRSAWSRFIMSLMFRSPERMKWIRDTLRAQDGQPLKDLTSEYERLRRPNDPADFKDYRSEGGSNLLDEAEALFLCKIIDSPLLGSHINNMIWNVSEFSSPNHGLLTSDSPIIMSNGVRAADGFLLMPISPSKFFLATNARDVTQAFIQQPPKEFERAINVAIVNQAEELVIGQTDQQRRFVENHMGHNGSPLKQGQLKRAFWRAPT